MSRKLKPPFCFFKKTKVFINCAANDFWKKIKIRAKKIHCACLAQFSTIFVFSKIICLNKFLNLQKCIYFRKLRLRENCWERESYCAPLAQLSTTFVFSKFAFLKIMFKQISKLTKMYLFSKGCVWEKIVEQEIYCARLAQLSTIFFFSKFKLLKIICFNKFRNWQKCIYFRTVESKRRLLRKRFIVLALRNSAQLLFIQKNKIAVLTSWTSGK